MTMKYRKAAIRTAFSLFVACLVLQQSVFAQTFNQETASVSRNANLRTGPGSNYEVITTLPSGTMVVLLGKEGNWYNTRTSVNGEKKYGWIHVSLVQIGGLAGSVRRHRSGTGSPGGAGPSTKSQIRYSGYSERIQPMKKLIAQGKIGEVRLDSLKKATARKEAKKPRSEESESSEDDSEYEHDDANAVSGSSAFLIGVEGGTVALDQGRFSESVEFFDRAERVLDERTRRSKTANFIGKIGRGLGGIVGGNEEVYQYRGEGYERVLMLNYKSFAYLLQGKRQAYNVARRAIDWQNIEKKKFEEELRKTVEKLSGKRKERGGSGSSEGSVERRVSKDYAVMDKKATSVPSAYVNPFGFYVSGMIQEYESYDDWSLRDNARISYKKALELNPKSKVLKKAVRDLKKPRAREGTRLVHVVVADGWVPEKKVLTYALRTQNGLIPVKLPIYQPVKSKVHRVDILTTRGTRLATASTVADIEAISLRHQKDTEPIRQLRVMGAVLTGMFVRGLATQAKKQHQQQRELGSAITSALFGVLANVREGMSTPDMRSWATLPAKISAARLLLRKGISKLKIVSYDKRGRRLASKIVKIQPRSHDFVYVRSLDKTMYAHSAEPLWLDSR